MHEIGHMGYGEVLPPKKWAPPPFGQPKCNACLVLALKNSIYSRLELLYMESNNLQLIAARPLLLGGLNIIPPNTCSRRYQIKGDWSLRDLESRFKQNTLN